MNPYTNKGNIRTFSKDVDPMELVWHQDDEDRKIPQGEDGIFSQDDI